MILADWVSRIDEIWGYYNTVYLGSTICTIQKNLYVNIGMKKMTSLAYISLPAAIYTNVVHDVKPKWMNGNGLKTISPHTFKHILVSIL